MCYLSVVQLEGGVVVVGVVVHPLVDHRHVAVDLLPAFLQRPVLSTLPAAALVRPAAQTDRKASLGERKLQTRPGKMLIPFSSDYLVVMTMTRTFCSQTILQKSP